MKKKKGQISIEYLVVMSFITLTLIGIVGVAFSYSASVSDQIRVNHVINFGNEVVSSAERVFYSGAPSQLTINPYMPSGVTRFQIDPNGKSIVFDVSTSHGTTQLAFASNVKLSGDINVNEGIKNIVLLAGDDEVSISS